VLSDFAGLGLLDVTAGDYTNIGDLVAELNLHWNVYAGPGSGIEFGAWSIGGEEGLTFGWDGSTVAAMMIILGERGNQPANDIRPIIGLEGLGIGGATTRLTFGAWLLPPHPAVAADELLYFDNWSLIDFAVEVDPVMANYAATYGTIAAHFDAAPPRVVEDFTLEGWFGPGATWVTEFFAWMLAPALFDSGLHAMEQFAPAHWPDEIWT
jgi:hypothetical protein